MLLLFTVPAMNSAGDGVYFSRTMRVNMSGVVLSTQSAGLATRDDADDVFRELQAGVPR